MTTFVQAFFVFIAMFATDICWAIYISRVKDKRAISSASWAVLLYLTGAVGTISIIGNPWMLIPASLGAFLGTYAAVKWEK